MLSKSLMAAASSEDKAWNLDNVEYLGSPLNFYINQEYYSQNGISLKSDGTKMYLLNSVTRIIYEYDLSTTWDISTASFNGTQSGYLGSTYTSPKSLFFKSDGTKLYFINRNYYITEATLSTPWDLSTISVGTSYSVQVQDSGAQGIYFSDDGLLMFMAGSSNDTVYKYSLSTAWNIGTMSYATNAKSVSAQDTTPQGLFFKPDGTRMFVIGNSNDRIFQYNLSTAWDLTTAVYDSSAFFYVNGQTLTPFDLSFKPDGTFLYLLGSNPGVVFRYPISTPWDLVGSGGIPYPTTRYFDVRSYESQPAAVYIRDDGLRMYIVGAASDRVYEYNVSTAWEIQTLGANTFYNYSVSSKETAPNGIFFKPDGTKMYISGTSSDAVHEYSLSTAWRVSTASFVQTFSVLAQVPQASGLFFSPDGTKMYLGNSSTIGNIYEYSLSVAWDIGTASFTQSANFSAQSTQWADVQFKPDGKKMYLLSIGNRSVYEYELSTAWDISTAVYTSRSFSFYAQGESPRGIFFKPDGLQMFMTGTQSHAVWTYDFV